jgi:uncharacterized protein (DUF1499 family)
MADTGVYGDKRYSLIAALGALIAIAAAGALFAGAYGYRAGWWDYRFAFRMINENAFYGGAVAAVLGLVGLGASLPGGTRRGFVAALIAIVLGGGAAGYIGNLYYIVKTVPYIHDITTDTDNPPQFVAVVAEREAEGANPHDYDYPGAKVALQQKASYPDIVPLTVSAPPAEVFDKALAIAETFGWRIVDEDAQAGRIEATDTTRWYKFKDDIVIRIAPAGTGATLGTRVDIRSKSRLGRSDLGVNAERIRSYLAQLANATGG